MVRAKGSRGTVALAALALTLSAAPAASADPVQQFAVQLKDLKSDGSYSVVYTSNAFDTSGGPPPALREAYMRLARGMTVRPEFLRRDRLCDTSKYAGFLLQNRPRGVSYHQMVDGFPLGRYKIRKRLPTVVREVMATCREAYIGAGAAVVDARPLYALSIPAKFTLYLTRPTAKGALFGIGVISHYDKTSPIAVTELRYALLQPIFTLNVFDDPTPDGKYGYRIRLLTERTSGFRFSIAELRAEGKGIRSKRSGRFWANPPRCPASGKVPFKAEFSYVTGLKTTTAIEVPCPRFRR